MKKKLYCQVRKIVLHREELVRTRHLLYSKISILFIDFMKFREETFILFILRILVINKFFNGIVTLTEVLDVFDVTLILCKGKFIYTSYLINFAHMLAVYQYRYRGDMVFRVRCGMYSSLIIIQW